jgi:cytochrome c-type biogenesis protein CcsB
MKEGLSTLVGASYACIWLAFVAYAVTLNGRRRRFTRAASVAAGIAWGGLTAALIARGLASGHWPLTTRYEFALCFAWGILGVYLLLELRWRERAGGASVMAVGLLVMSYALLRPEDEKVIRPLVPALRSVWLQFHVVAAAIGYGSCGVAAGLAVAQLAGMGNASRRESPSPAQQDTHQQEAGGVTPALACSASVVSGSIDNAAGSQGSSEAISGPGVPWHEQSLRRSNLSPAEDIARQTLRVVGWGFPWLTAALVTGAIWAQDAWGRYWAWDPKETWSLITWLWFLLLLHSRELRGWRGRRMAWLILAGFGIVLFAFAGLPWLLRTVSMTSLHGF